MIQFEKVSKRYSAQEEALSKINFCLERGEMAFLTGHSGAGKSTLMKLICLIERPTQGEITVNNQKLKDMTTRRIPYLRRSIGIIFQNPQLLPDRSVYDNVALPLVVAGFPHQDIGRRVRAALDKVSLLNKERASPLALSTGEQQRVGIARAIVNKPAVLLADEPTGNLDPALSAEIMHLFEQFNQVGVTILIARHELALIARLQHRILELQGGRLVNDGLTKVTNA